MIPPGPGREPRLDELARPRGEADVVCRQERGLLIFAYVPPYIERDGRERQAAGEKADRALEGRDAPELRPKEPPRGLDPQGRRAPEVAAPVLEAAEAAIGPAFPDHAVEGLLEDAGEGGAQGLFDKEREGRARVRAKRLQALVGHWREKAGPLEPFREIVQAPFEAALRGAVEPGGDLTESVDLHVDPRGVEHGQAKPRKYDREQEYGHGDGPSRMGTCTLGTCPRSDGITGLWPGLRS